MRKWFDNMSLMEYMCWRLLRATLIFVTSPIWFPVLLLMAATGGMVESFVDAYEQWLYDYERRQREKRRG